MKNPLKRPQKLAYKYLEIFKEVEKMLLAFYSFIVKKTEVAGKADAGSPPPKDTPIAVFPYVEEIKKACTKQLSKVYKDLAGALEVVLTEYNYLYDRINTYLGVIQQKMDVLKVQKESALANVLKIFKEKEEGLVKKIESKKNYLQALVVDFKKMKRVSVFWACAFTIFLNILFTVGDMAYVAKAFALTGLGFFEQYLIAGIVGLASGIVAAGAVESVRSNWNLVRKIATSVVLIAFVIGLYVFIGQLRVDLVAQSTAKGVVFSELSAMEFSLVNIAIFCAIIIIHTLAWPSKATWKLYRDYKNAKKDIAEAEKEIKKLERESQNIPDELAKKQADISAKYDAPISVLEKEQQGHIDQLESRQTTYNNMLSSLNQFHIEINAFFQETVCLYVGILNKYNHGGHFIVMDDSIKDITNPFDKYSYLENSLPEVTKQLTTAKPDYADIELELNELLTNTSNNDYENTEINL